MSSSNGTVTGSNRFSGFYGYEPSKSAALAFMILFGLSTLAHIVQTVAYRRRRYWWTLVFAAGGIMEVIGWEGRFRSAQDVQNKGAFLQQIVCLVIAPAWFSAACYQLTGSFILRLGRHGSLLGARVYMVVFVLCDVVSIALQAAGGAAVGAETDAGESPEKGRQLLLSGVAFQLGAMIVYLALSVLYFVRRWSDFSPLRRRLAYGTIFGSVCIIVRGILRTAELAEGWKGYISVHEAFTIYLDGLPILLCIVGFNVVHPVYTLDVGAEETRDDVARDKLDGDRDNAFSLEARGA